MAFAARYGNQPLSVTRDLTISDLAAFNEEIAAIMAEEDELFRSRLKG